MYWLDSTAEHLPYPALVQSFAEGVSKPTKGQQQVTGLKATLGDDLRETLGQQFIDHLATVHDVSDPKLACLPN